jgi:uncharacterized protein (DUF1330 family)
MPKGYWLPQIDVSNMEGYRGYMAASSKSLRVIFGHAR